MGFPKANLAILALFSALAGPVLSQEKPETGPDINETTTLAEIKNQVDESMKSLPGSKFISVTSSKATESDSKLMQSILKLSDMATFNEHGQGISQITLGLISQPDIVAKNPDLNQMAERILEIYEPFDTDRSMTVAPGKPAEMGIGEWQNKYYMQKFVDKVEQELGVTLTVIVLEQPNANIRQVPMEELQKERQSTPALR